MHKPCCHPCTTPTTRIQRANQHLPPEADKRKYLRGAGLPTRGTVYAKHSTIVEFNSVSAMTAKVSRMFPVGYAGEELISAI